MGGVGLGEVLVLAVLLLVLLVLAALLAVQLRRGPQARPAPTTELEEAQREAVALRAHASRDAAAVREQAQTRAQELRAEAGALRDDLRVQRLDLERREQRLRERQERLDLELRQLESRLAALYAVEDERTRILEQAAGLTGEQAKRELVRNVEQSAKREAAAAVRVIEDRARTEADARARTIVTAAIQRLASEQTAESTVAVLHLPGDDMKGRIIGREGRNIRAFEAASGVNLIIDDTPEAVLLSCFDPVRREIARLALETLVADGRISPHRIEEVLERSRAQVDQANVRAGEDALVEVGVTDIHPEIVTLLGRLRFRTSYGQNVLRHLVESAHLAGLMAAELGLEPALAKRCAFLHDIGKAVTSEVEGSHAAVGAALARRCGESDAVVHAIEAHHDEVEPSTVEAVLTQAADAISGSRPGARRESLESYLKRLERLEEIAAAHEGVEKAYAMQAGREVRVMVHPDAVDDLGAQVIARDIAKQVEEELTYPGQVRITVIRESRATEVAR
ncbi:MAG: ribonuclease Y [Actinomycetota bacterium]|nr:ribonuclease Y [Actinomycetota bacterium]